MPGAIIVGPAVYEVVLDKAEMNAVCREEMRDLLGSTSHRKLVITIDPDQAPGCMRDTLLHECLHTLAMTTDAFDSREQEEAGVGRLSPVLLDLLRRNPGLVSYLLA